MQRVAQTRFFDKYPVIIAKGYDDSETRARANALEPLAYLNKPLEFTLLVKILESI